ncbi:glycosyltransferase [Flavobacterium soyangense]|uniref:Glycosyltransferase n=1 Tax=Flavobacterium soyangense TaxID=2023265 RepID=A0A930UBD0_9FLAO|nr:glycosyltransferase [Flavobacterium soyangense]MBF2708191.1 glycosyltransferase [Flavobacterium soyangense]
MKKAFITDWLDKYGGAERVVSAINEIYEFDYYYAYVNKMTLELQKKTFGNRDVNVISSRIMSLFKYKFRILMPFFPYIIKKFNKQTKQNEIDLVISSSWTMSKGYRSGNELHICYLQARNFKYVWEEADLYFKGPLKLVSFVKGYLQRFDIESARNPDYLISNSVFVQNWVKERYKRDSVVIYPPVDVEDFYISDTTDDYYVTVGRLEPYKRFDIVVEAFTQNKKKLVVIGDGTQSKYLKSIAGVNIEFTGYLEKTKIKDYLSKSKAFVFAGVEDFGIVIVEAHASGVPTIVFSGGAANEIVTPENGLCYNIQNAESLNSKLIDFENQYLSYNKNKIRESSLKFSKERFKNEIRTYVESLKVKCLPHLN